VLVVMGVPLALISAGTAGCGAGLDGRADGAEIVFRLARHHAAGGVAQIGAIKTQANATDHVSNVLLGETRVGASSARGGAVDAVFNAANKRLAIGAGWVWMRRDDLSNTHVDPFPFPTPAPQRLGVRHRDEARGQRTASGAYCLNKRKGAGASRASATGSAEFLL
jgi:hypothetical protein